MVAYYPNHNDNDDADDGCKADKGAFCCVWLIVVPHKPQNQVIGWEESFCFERRGGWDQNLCPPIGVNKHYNNDSPPLNFDLKNDFLLNLVNISLILVVNQFKRRPTHSILIDHKRREIVFQCWTNGSTCFSFHLFLGVIHPVTFLKATQAGGVYPFILPSYHRVFPTIHLSLLLPVCLSFACFPNVEVEQKCSDLTRISSRTCRPRTGLEHDYRLPVILSFPSHSQVSSIWTLAVVGGGSS